MECILQFGKRNYLFKFTLVFIFRYDKELSLWKAKNVKHPNFYAISKAPIGTLLLGTYTWSIHNDSPDCPDAQATTR